MEGLLLVLNAMSPVLVAGVGAYSAITVAKLSKMQKDIKTNHGTSNIGEAIDIIRSRVDSISLSQDKMATAIDELKLQDEKTANKLSDINERVEQISEED